MSSAQECTALPEMAPRPRDANKGMFGRILVVAGSKGMSGAAVLCGSAALRGGAGLVRVAVPEGIQPQVAVGNPCYTTTALPQEADGVLALAAVSRIAELASIHDVVILGPGLGQNNALPMLAGSLVAEVTKPMVIDADGLNALHDKLDLFRSAPAPRILTPHPGEFARLTKLEIVAVQSQRRSLAVQFAQDHGVVLVLKGAGTLVSDGKRVYENSSGNPGMATGGTGDVLSGLIGALLGQGLAPFEAAQLAVYLHGRAGDLAAQELSEAGMIASDLLHYVPLAIREHEPKATKAKKRNS